MVHEVLPAKFGLLLLCSVIGLFGGGIRAALRRDPTVPPVRDVLTQAAASWFAAFIAAAVCMDRLEGTREYLMLAIAGVTGWAGATVLDAATRGGTKWLESRLDRTASNQEGAKPSADPTVTRTTIEGERP